ncbi:MAG: hypothetical protein FJ404_03555 [Verrucomicrobia bacterium]|nr:hypothetical protein [Verrucomicrobiota bacterium]
MLSKRLVPFVAPQAGQPASQQTGQGCRRDHDNPITDNFSLHGRTALGAAARCRGAPFTALPPRDAARVEFLSPRWLPKVRLIALE